MKAATHGDGRARLLILAGGIATAIVVAALSGQSAGSGESASPQWLAPFEWAAFASSLLWARWALKNLTSTKMRSVSFLMVVFFAIYGVPVLLDLTQGIPEYYATPGFNDAANSTSTRLVYDLFVIACPIFWFLTTKTRPRYADSWRMGKLKIVSESNAAQCVLWAFLASPLLVLPFAPEPAMYLRYAAVLTDRIQAEIADFHGIVALLAMLALVAGHCLLLVRRNFGRTLWLVAPFLLFATWVQGKRTAVALVFMLFWAVAWMRGYLTRGNMLKFGAVAVFLFGGYIAWYQVTFRPSVVEGVYNAYENSRIDYGRDHVMRAAIFAEMTDTAPILEYRGQSVLFNFVMPIRRDVWPDKPWPYAYYITAYALQIPAAELGWGLTSSFLDEAVANFGWAGMLIGPLVFSLICRVCDGTPDSLVKVVGVLIGCLLMTVELVAFAPLAIGWVLYVCWVRLTSRNARRPAVAVAVREVAAKG